jgi:hypothetical protein
MTKISKDTPLAEITLRRYEKPENLQGRELTRKLCLSLGLLQPGDSRDVMVDVLHVILKEKKKLSSKQIEELVIKNRKEHKLELKGIAGSNIRRQLKRLKDLLIIESKANHYQLTENESLKNIFTEKIKKFYLQSIIERVEEYIEAIK